MGPRKRFFFIAMNQKSLNHKYFLIFDVGSNAVKASLVREKMTPLIDKNWHIETGLTKYIEKTGSLSQEGMRVLLEALQNICHDAELYSDEIIPKYAIGTEALRRICNAAEIIEMVRRECHIELTVISADIEAQLERRAVKTTEIYQQNREKCILCFDSGGSSTEFNFLIPNCDNSLSMSYPFGQHDIKNAIQNGSAMPFIAMFDNLKTLVLKYRPELVVAAGSSFTSYAKYALKIKKYKHADIENKVIEAGVPVPPDDLKSQCGSRLIAAIYDVVKVPIYVTTRGIRHGWIDLKMHENSQI